MRYPTRVPMRDLLPPSKSDLCLNGDVRSQFFVNMFFVKRLTYNNRRNCEYFSFWCICELEWAGDRKAHKLGPSPVPRSYIPGPLALDTPYTTTAQTTTVDAPFSPVQTAPSLAAMTSTAAPTHPAAAAVRLDPVNVAFKPPPAEQVSHSLPIASKPARHVGCMRARVAAASTTEAHRVDSDWMLSRTVFVLSYLVVSIVTYFVVFVSSYLVVSVVTYFVVITNVLRLAKIVRKPARLAGCKCARAAAT
ncbi:hypothetical protein VOLCADRAFT_108789, partial [Volvox carteri f. nagariensis]